MREPETGEDLRGKVCVCSTGRIAVVARKEFIEDIGKTLWVGVSFDGKGTWASSYPVVSFESVEDYMDCILERFGGRMSFNG